MKRRRISSSGYDGSEIEDVTNRGSSPQTTEDSGRRAVGGDHHNLSGCGPSCVGARSKADVRKNLQQQATSGKRQHDDCWCEGEELGEVAKFVLGRPKAKTGNQRNSKKGTERLVAHVDSCSWLTEACAQSRQGSAAHRWQTRRASKENLWDSLAQERLAGSLAGRRASGPSRTKSPGAR